MTTRDNESENFTPEDVTPENVTPENPDNLEVAGADSQLSEPQLPGFLGVDEPAEPDAPGDADEPVAPAEPGDLTEEQKASLVAPPEDIAYEVDDSDIVVAGSAPRAIASEADTAAEAVHQRAQQKEHTFLRGAGRALTGTLIVAASATAVITLNTIDLPSHFVTAPSVTVNTANEGNRSLVCPGGFAWLGADAARPGAAIPTGTAAITRTDGEVASAPHKDGNADAHPTVFEVPAGALPAAAQTQELNTSELRGLAAATCGESTTDQWLVGGSTNLGHSSSLTVTNPSERPATVTVGVFHEEGLNDDGERTGLLVPAGESRSISLNGLAPGRSAIVAHVQSTGTAVTATMSTSHVTDIYPQGLDTVTAQPAPLQSLVIPGLTTVVDAQNTDAETQSTVSVRLLNTSDTTAKVVLTALREEGQPVEVGTVDLEPETVTDTEIADLPQGTTAVRVDSDQTIVGSGLGYNQQGGNSDFAWFPNAPQLDTDVSAAIVKGGQLTLVNAYDLSLIHI